MATPDIESPDRTDLKQIDHEHFFEAIDSPPRQASFRPAFRQHPGLLEGSQDNVEEILDWARVSGELQGVEGPRWCPNASGDLVGLGQNASPEKLSGRPVPGSGCARAS